MVPRVVLPPPPLLLPLLNAKREDAFTEDFRGVILTLSARKMNAESSSAFDDAFESANVMIMR